MLIYCNNLQLQPADGFMQIIGLIAKWMGQRTKGYVVPEELARGVRMRLRDGSIVESKTTAPDRGSVTYPFLFATQLSHGDEQVPGRKWMSEIGLRQEEELGPVHCSILLKTDEISARVTSPIQVTRPKLVNDLFEVCNPLPLTPGLSVRHLDESSAQAFSVEVERDDRTYPIVVVSAGRDGQFRCAPERLRSLLVGIASIVEVPSNVDSFELERVLGRRYCAWGGAINIIFPSRRGREGTRYCESSLLFAGASR